MSNNISPIRSPRGGDMDKSGRVKPQGQPRNDNFKKISRDKPSPKDDDDVHGMDEQDTNSRPPSLFDLQRKNKLKNKSPGTGGEGIKTPSKNPASLDRGLSELTDEGVSTEEFSPLTDEDKVENEFLKEGVEQSPEQPINEQSPMDEQSLADKTEEGKQPPSPQFSTKKTDKEPTQELTTQEAGQQQAEMLQSRKGKAVSSFEKEETQGLKKSKSKTKIQPSREPSSNEKGNSAAIHSSIQSTAFNSDKVQVQATQESAQSATIKELAAQIIERIQVMRREDRTETIVTLRHPPELIGSTLTLTASDHAKREFNVSFTNLSPEAKRFLDQKLAESPLADTLGRKGIIVHMVTTTTQVENPLNVEAGQASREQQQQQQQEQQQQQGENPDEEMR